MKQLIKYQDKKVKIILGNEEEIIGTTLGCTSAIDNDGEESIDIKEEKTGRVYEFFESDIKDIQIL